jgi:hypothetical protein
MPTLLGLSIMQWIQIMGEVPTAITALEKAAPTVTLLLQNLAGVASKGLSAGEAALVVTNNPYGSVNDWNAWAEQMRPDLVTKSS